MDELVIGVSCRKRHERDATGGKNVFIQEVFVFDSEDDRGVEMEIIRSQREIIDRVGIEHWVARGSDDWCGDGVVMDLNCDVRVDRTLNETSEA
jgi:hypothetical protein